MRLFHIHDRGGSPSFPAPPIDNLPAASDHALIRRWRPIAREHLQFDPGSGGAGGRSSRAKRPFTQLPSKRSPGVGWRLCDGAAPGPCLQCHSPQGQFSPIPACSPRNEFAAPCCELVFVEVRAYPLHAGLNPLFHKTQASHENRASRHLSRALLPAEIEYRAKSAEGKVCHPFFEVSTCGAQPVRLAAASAVMDHGSVGHLTHIAAKTACRAAARVMRSYALALTIPGEVQELEAPRRFNITNCTTGARWFGRLQKRLP